MTRRSAKTTTHVHRVSGQPSATGDAKGKDLLLHRHRLLRRTTGFMLARKYRNPWPTESDFARELSARFTSRAEKPTTANGAVGSTASETASMDSSTSLMGLNGPKGYTREELINFWRELSLVAKRRLLRIRRETYLTALDQFLVGQNLCCECHDNVIAEWEDHERKRSGSRSLQDVFSVFPPFLDDEEEDEEDEEDEDEEADELRGELEDESDQEMLATEDMMLENEELVFKYELEREGKRGAGKAGMLSDEYLAALEVGRRQEDELLRLIQKEERFIIIREDHSDFIMDLIRCGEQFSYVSPFRSGFEDGDSEDSEVDDEDEDDLACPGANTSHLAQEYLLEVLAIKFREQLEDAYQDALQHSLAIQAELLRDELADLKASQKPTSSKKKRSKDKKKRRKKDAAAAAAAEKEKPTEQVTPRVAPVEASTSSRAKTKDAAKTTNQRPTLAGPSESSDTETRSPEEDAIDREVEQFRLLLEKINSESAVRSRKKLVLPPGSFAHLRSMAVS